jgi:hypothetical protein
MGGLVLSRLEGDDKAQSGAHQYRWRGDVAVLVDNIAKRPNVASEGAVLCAYRRPHLVLREGGAKCAVKEDRHWYPQSVLAS